MANYVRNRKCYRQRVARNVLTVSCSFTFSRWIKTTGSRTDDVCRNKSTSSGKHVNQS